MQQLLTYLNGLDTGAQVAFALRCKTTLGYLRKAAYSRTPCRFGVDLCLAIAQESGGAVRPHQLRPDVDWLYLYAAMQSVAQGEKVAA